MVVLASVHVPMIEREGGENCAILVLTYLLNGPKGPTDCMC